MKFQHKKSAFIGRFLFLFFILNGLTVHHTIFAQTADTLSFKQLFAEAVAKNYGIKIAQNNLEISKLNNSIGNAGFLPKIDMAARDAYSLTSDSKTYFDGTESSTDNAGNLLFDAYVQLNWTVFDGLAMFIRKNKLEQYKNLSETQLQAEIESVYIDLATLYYNMVQEQKLAQILQYTLDISKFRLNLAEQKFRLGSASELDKIQASLDFNNDSSEYLTQQIRLKSTKAQLNQLIGRSPETLFSVGKDVQIGTVLVFDSLQKLVTEQNSSVLLAKLNASIKAAELREATSGFLPTLSVFADYGYYNSLNYAGTLKSNDNWGPSAGVRLSYTIFDGFNRIRKNQVARIEYQTSEIRLENSLNEVKAQLYQTYNSYSGALTQIKLESGNLSDARRNLQIAMETYQRGALNEVEFREIQRKVIQLESRFLQAQFAAKLSELRLLHLSGKLALQE
ncbi:MAG TPA: hypothetical protein DCQ31_00605 [Bacteroidales bacterium]|nr:hypothetical protein [Bacteroidales bacterium]